MSLTTDLETLDSDIRSAIAGAADERALEAVRVSALGKKGTVSAAPKRTFRYSKTIPTSTSA